MPNPVLANAVEHHDRVVDREADDGQHGWDEQRVDLQAGERAQYRKRADDHDHVVQDPNERRRAHSDVRESERHPGKDADRAQDDQQDRLLAQLRTDEWPNGRLLENLVDRPVLRLEGSAQLAELAGGRQDRARRAGWRWRATSAGYGGR